jgi:FixJ family two-component response regulator
MCKALQRLLRVSGFDVDTFDSGEAFLTSLPTQTPDCVLLDLHMPGVSGFDVQSRLAEARITVPVIVITGHDAPGTFEQVMAAGAADYLCKPVTEDALLASITRCLAGR